MEHLNTSDRLLIAVGLASALWCAGLTLFIVRSDQRQRADSLNAISLSFAWLVASLGESVRKLKH